MRVLLYNSSADPRYIDKLQYITLINEVDAKPVFPITLPTPKFRLKYNASFASINYIYVPDFNRYYFVSKTTLESGSAMLIDCECDVLMSFKTEILAVRAICYRNEFDYNKYMNDFAASTVRSETKAYTFNTIEESPFGMPTDENTYCYTLTTAGMIGEET